MTIAFFGDAAVCRVRHIRLIYQTEQQSLSMQSKLATAFAPNVSNYMRMSYT